MLKYIFISFIFLSSVVHGVGQVLSVGVKVGASSAGISGGVPGTFNIGKKSVASPVAGLVANYTIDSIFSLQLEGYYLKKGGGYGITVSGKNYSEYYTFNYVEVPLLIKVTIGQPRVKFIANAGPYFGYVINASHISEDGGIRQVEPITDFSSYDDNGVQTRRFDIGLQLGTGFSVDIGRGRLFVEGRYGMGFVNWFKFKDSPPGLIGKVQHRVASINVGYAFPVWIKPKK